ncbi:hypothetical protein GCM10009743_62070 [Kribbella swartbergensis]
MIDARDETVHEKPARAPRAIPDSLWGELSAQLRCVRDWEPPACFVSSGESTRPWQSATDLRAGRMTID